MPLIKKDFVDRVVDRSKADAKDLVEIIASFAGSEPRKEGASYKTACPSCGSEHSLVITPGKQVFKCFNCNSLQGKTPLDYLMKGQSMSYTEAIEWLASYYNMVVEYEEPARKTSAPKKKGKSFCARMLEESGLTVADVTATVKDDSQYKRPTFHPGTINSRGEIDESGDDAIIRYYDLEGKPIIYTVQNDKTAKEREYCRVRYQFPSEHTDRNGREMKYRSPSGAPTFVYYPQKIRALYQAAKQIPTLYIQEGEKKAEKACKHGIDSVAVSGIQNIGQNGSLPEEIIKLIEVCKVKEVVFLLDSDCFDLTHHIKVDDPIDRRPKNFFYAIKNYKEYFNKLKNREIYVELFFGYVLKNERDDKGIDDLLTNTLKGKEEDLLKDINTAKNEKHLTGQYVKLHKITTINITVLNNCADSIVKGGFCLSDLVPSITMGELIIWLKDRFGAVCVFDGHDVWIRLMESCLNTAPDMDLTDFAGNSRSIVYPVSKRIVASVATDIEGAEPVAETLTEFTKKYSRPENIGTPADIPDTIDGLWFVRATGTYFKRKGGVLTEIGSNAFTYDRGNAEESEEKSAEDKYLPMVLSGSLLMPNVGTRIHRNSSVAGEKNEQDAPIMVCWAFYEDGHWFGSTQINKADGGQVRLAVPGPLTPEGMFGTFWKSYNSLLLNGAPEINQPINLPVSVIMSLDVTTPKILSHSKVMIKSYLYDVSIEGVRCKEMSLMLLPSYANAIEDPVPEFSDILTWQYINTEDDASSPSEHIYEIIETQGDGLTDYSPSLDKPVRDPERLGQIAKERNRSRTIIYVVDEGGSVNYSDLRYYTNRYKEYFLAVTKVD